MRIEDCSDNDLLNELGERKVDIIKDIPTCELIETLIRREGVKTINVEPYEEYFIDTSSIKQDEIEDTGPATILIVTD